MGKSSKKMKKQQKKDYSSDDDDMIEHQLQNDNHANGDEDHSDDEEEYDSDMEMMNFENKDVSGSEDSDSMGDDDNDDDDNDDEKESDDDGLDMKIEDNNLSDMEELEKEYTDLRNQEQDIFRNLRRDQNEDLQKAEAVKNQRALWDKNLELRFLLQKSFLNSNRLPQEPIRSAFCNSDEEVKEAYSDLIDSTKKTLDSILKLQEALVDKNPSIMEANEEKNSTSVEASKNSVEGDEEWIKISKMQSRIGPFRDTAVDKWQRKTQVTSGVAGIKNKFQAFNQNISEQVASFMRDPSRMVKGMQQRRSVVPVFGDVSNATPDNNNEVTNEDGDPDLLDDSEFYQQLLREFFETVDPKSSDTAFYALKRLQTKKRKIVDRRASKSRKIRYHIHEKIVNFMAPEPMNIPPMAPKLFENLFGLKTHSVS